jgi:hypothetical protein
MHPERDQTSARRAGKAMMLQENSMLWNWRGEIDKCLQAGLLTRGDGRADLKSSEVWSLGPRAATVTAANDDNQTCLHTDEPASTRCVNNPPRHVSKRSTIRAMLVANSKLSIDEIAERVGVKRHYVKRIIHGWP